MVNRHARHTVFRPHSVIDVMYQDVSGAALCCRTPLRISTGGKEHVTHALPELQQRWRVAVHRAAQIIQGVVQGNVLQLLMKSGGGTLTRPD